MKKKFPKVLVVGQYFSYKKGGGISQSNLFQGWDKENIACVPYNLPDIDGSVCKKYYRLGDKEIIINYPILYSKIKDKSKGFEVSENTNDKKDDYCSSPSISRKGFLKKIKNYIVNNLGLYYNAYKITPSKQLLKWINDFNPDVIYAQYSTLSTMRFVSKLTKEIKKPLVVHFMDDWIQTVNKPNLLKKYWEGKIEFEFENLLKLATKRLAISGAMSKEYEKRYGYKFQVFHNPIDTNFWLKASKRSWEYHKPFKIMYAGRIGLGILNSLIDIAKAIEIVNRSGNVAVFQIQSTTYDVSIIERLKQFDCVKFNSIMDYSDIPKKFSSVDALVLPLDFDYKGLKFIKYSMPTKTSEYMITGTPIIIYASAETALAKYASERKWGLVVTNQDVKELSEEIRKLIENLELRENIGKKAQRLAIQLHSINIVSNSFRDTLLQASLNN